MESDPKGHKEHIVKDEFEWDEDTLISFIEDDTIFGPEGVYGWFMNLWCKVWV